MFVFRFLIIFYVYYRILHSEKHYNKRLAYKSGRTINTKKRYKPIKQHIFKQYNTKQKKYNVIAKSVVLKSPGRIFGNS